MHRWRLPLAGLLLLILNACAAPGSGPAEPQTVRQTVPLAASGQELAFAEIDAGPPLAVRYATNSLYQAGAALPSTDGLAALQSLADWLGRAPQNQWQAIVTVTGGAGEEQRQALADKRAALLQRFFTRQGLTDRQLRWEARTTDGPELELRQLNGPS